jgi:peptidoglycan/LPS O-acetylase OafA/YrhL
MTLQAVIELVLALGAVLLLARDMRRAWLDQLRRPVTLLMAAVVAALLVGVTGGRPHPSPWWLVLPGGILVWEVGRGWRRAPRCHLWEAGVGAFAGSLLLVAVGLGSGGGSIAAALLTSAAGAAVVGAGLLWRSHRREPRPERVGDVSHYERRLAQRPRG